MHHGCTCLPLSGLAPAGAGDGVWEEIWEKGRELLFPALLPTFHVVTEGPRRLLGQEMTGHSESQGLLRVGGALTMPPAGGGCQGGGWEENQALPM